MQIDWWQLARNADGTAPYAAPATLVLFAVSAAVVLAVVRNRRRRLLGVAMALAVCAVLGSLLTPAASPSWWWAHGATDGFRCTAAGSWPLGAWPASSVGIQVFVFNVLLFVPVTAVGVWLLPRPWQVPLLAAGFGVACELAQGSTPALGRVCDGADLVGYGYGIAIGTVVGVLGLLAGAAGRHPAPAGRRDRDVNHGPGGGATGPGSLACPGRSPMTTAPGQPEGDPQQWRARER